MGKENDVLKTLQEKSVSRRSFMKGAVALGAMASVYGCSKDSGSDIIYGGGTVTVDGITSDDLYYTETPTYRYGTSAHNCGGRCIIKAQVTPDGRIVRFLTDETKYAYDGTSIDNDHPNTTQARACSRCRAYKGRLYHPGRLKYPLKQTKERGDVTGFKRISWEQALSDIVARLKAVQNKYGAEAFHSIYACGNIASQFQGGGYTGLFASADGITPTLCMLGGSSAYTSDYSFHQGSYMGGYGTAYSGMIHMSPTPEFLDRYMHFVMWGSNIPTTHNPKSFAWTKGIENMKKHGGTVKFIGPELSEIGIAQANEWIRTKPYTDVALILGMLNHMIKLTFNEDGTPTGNGLDVDYLDQMVYGFFETPAYWRNTTTGEISFDDKSADGNYVYVAAIPAGQSFSAYIMGDDTRLTQAKYSVSNNYMAQQFATKVDKRNTSVANFKVADNTKYEYKKQINVEKNPEWAQGITGVPKEKIEELAEFYLQCAKDRTPVYNEWSGGQLKQNDGTITLYALQALLIISKNWGITGTGIKNNSIGVSKTTDPNQITNSMLRPSTWNAVDAMGPHPIISVTQWHTAIKMAFAEELKANGYEPNIPDWTNNTMGLGQWQGKKGEVYFDDGGVKSLVNRQGITGVGKDAPETFKANIEVTIPGKGKQTVTHTYYNFKDSGYTNNQTVAGNDLVDKTNDSKVLFSGYRFILNSAGNIPMNQHANPIDSARMYKALPTFGYGEHQAADMADAFYLVTFDNFMSPSARYSDYVLPAKTTWEQEDFVTIENSGTLYVDSVIPGPGESKSTWDFARELIYHYGGKDKAKQFTGLESTSSFRDVVQYQYNKNIKTNSDSPYYGKTWEEFLEKPISHAKPTTERADMKTHDIRAAYEAKQPMDPFYPGVTTVDWSLASGVYGFCGEDFAETESCPKQTGMFQVYSGTLVWRYENLYSKWHGYLPKVNQGQKNTDEEGDPIAWPIPVYFNYEDHFVHAYGLSSSADLAGRYLLTTTHDRFRAHSSQAENPFLRELTHRTIGGALYSGNDSGAYAVSNGLNAEGYETFPALNTLIGEDGKPVAGAENRASYADIWVNDVDFKDYNDGDLVKVSNEIGAVYCTIRKTARCVPGYVGLHQGCWVDFRGDINNKDSLIDVGGNCNTLMPSTPSRLDHGNGVQSAMVKIEPVR